MKRLVAVEAYKLPAVDILRLIEGCESLKQSKEVRGHHRDELEAVIDDLRFYLSIQDRGMVLLPSDLFAKGLRMMLDLTFEGRFDLETPQDQTI